MKKTFLIITLLFVATNIYSQQHFFYKCKDVKQKDSIASDLKNKGYVGYECDNALFLDLQSDHTFCFKASFTGDKLFNLTELYSNVTKTTEYDAKQIERDDWCSDIEEKEDKFTNEVSYNSPDVDNISFIKYKRKGIIRQYVSISIYNSFLSGYENYGLIVLFKSGKKIIRKNEKVDVNNSTGSDWRYSVFFTPTLNEISMFKSDEVIGVKLYIFDAEIKQGDKIKQYAKCILSAPKSVQKKKK
jgi:hypothetical protein